MVTIYVAVIKALAAGILYFSDPKHFNYISANNIL
jgi:hypothetical protein